MSYFTTECGNSIGYTITNSSRLFYYKVTIKYQYFTTKCDIIPQCVTFGVVFPMGFTTTIDIVPQSVAFLLQSVVFPIYYPATNCSTYCATKYNCLP